jgi:tetratricopeptide (TPR) repeat protein
MCLNGRTVATVGRVRRACFGLGAALVLLASGCTELRGRRLVREGNRLYREGRYQEAVASYEQAESLIPNFSLLWLNKGLTCRQLMIPGSRQSTNESATNCALGAFEKLRALRPSDPRGDALYVQTLFDGDRFQTLADLYQARLRTNPSDLLAMSGLIRFTPAGTTWKRRSSGTSGGRRWPRTTPRPSTRSACSSGVSSFKRAAAPRWRRSTRAPTRRSQRRRRRRRRPGWATSWARSGCDWPIWASRTWSAP